jgi:hypothetical protein
MDSPSQQDSVNAGAVSVPHVVPADQIAGDDDEETALLRQMLEEAKAYIISFSWCDSIHTSYFGGGIGKIFAIFLFNISTTRVDVDPWIWIIVGDMNGTMGQTCAKRTGGFSERRYSPGKRSGNTRMG